MTTLDYLDSEIIRFPTLLSKANNIFCLSMNIIGIFACVWLLATNLFRSQSASTKLLLSTIFADLVFLGSCTFSSFRNQINGGFSLGKFGCLVNYYCIVTPACVSIATLGVVAWERYQIVCRGNQWSDTTVNASIAGVWGFFGIVIGTPIFTSNYSSIRLDINSINCIVSWFDRSPQSLVMTTIIIMMFGVSFSVVAFSYYNVYLTFRAVTKKKKSNEDNQRVVFHKCVAMTLSLLVFWTPYYLKAVYEIGTGISVCADWASIANMAALACSVMNPIILCVYDNRVKGNMLAVFGSFIRKVNVSLNGTAIAQKNQTRTILL